MAGFRGYNEEDFKVGIRPSQMWREIADIVRSDFKLVKCYDVPTFSDTSKKIEVKSIGATKRNSIQEIGARGAEFTFRQMITDNYMNVCGDIIETSLGKIIKRVDGNGDFYSAAIASYGISIKDDVYNVAGIYSVGSNPFYIKFKKNGRTILEASTTVVATTRDTATEIMTELLSQLEADDTTTSYLVIVDGLDGTGTIAVTDDGNDKFDSYECSDNLSVGCVINLSATVSDLLGADFVNDKTIIPCVIVDAAIDTVLDMVYVTRKLSDTQVVCAGSVYRTAFNSDFSSIFLKAIGFIDLDENESYTTDYMFVRSAEYLSGESNELRAAGAKCLSLINTLGSAKLEFPVQDKPMIEVMAKADSYEYTKPMNDDNVDATEEWKEATREGSILEPLATFPDSIAGSVVPTWTMEFGINGVSVAPNANDTHFGVYINGEEFKVAKGSHASIYLALEELKALINADADSRYTATAHNGTSGTKANIVITSVDNFKKLHCQGFVDATSLTVKTAVTSVETIAANADVYSEIAKTVKFSKFLIGTSFCNLRDFCEVGKLTVDITREIAEIPSVCGEQGRKGWDNSTYSIYVTVDTTDIQSVRVYDKWAKYIGNQNFILLAVDVDSGLGFLFPKCRFEEHIQQAMNNLQGHQYKINVNFDPEKKFVIVLPQNLTA